MGQESGTHSGEWRGNVFYLPGILFQPHPDVELKNPTLKFQNPDPTIYSSVENSSENSNSKKIVSFPKVNQSTPSRVNKSISPHQTGNFQKKSSGVIFFQGTKPRPVSTTTPLPRTCRKATLPRARFTIRNCGLAGSEKRMIKALESCDGWESIRDTFAMKTWLFYEIASFLLGILMSCFLL